MRDRSKAIALCVMLSIALFCSPVFVGEQADEEILVQDNSAFAIDLYQKLCASDGNIKRDALKILSFKCDKK